MKQMESGRLVIETTKMSGELVRIYDKAKEREVLWCGDPDIWGWHSPILFPFIAKCYEESFKVDGVVYPIMSHGFARNQMYTIVSESDREVWYEITSTEETRKMYPFDFVLQLGYRLEENKIRVMWRVKNTSAETMHYCIGAHPAFVMPEGVEKSDVYISFGGQERIPYITNDFKNSGCAFYDEVLYIDLPGGKAQMKDLFHDMDTYIFEHGEIQEATIILPDGDPYVSVHCDKFPAFGYWTKKGSRFICLEPWYGRCDNIGFTGELKDKALVQHLEPDQWFETDYVIEIH